MEDVKFNQILRVAITQTIRQGEASVIPTTSKCCYRASKKDGTILKCVVGHIIPDKHYLEKMEGNLIRTLTLPFEFSYEQLKQLSILQDYHDGSSSLSLNFTSEFIDCLVDDPIFNSIYLQLREENFPNIKIEDVIDV